METQNDQTTPDVDASSNQEAGYTAVPALDESEIQTQAPRQEGPPVGSPRWNEIYFKAKDRDRLEEELKELRPLKDEIQQLRESVSTMSTSSQEARMSNIKAEMKAAYAAGDFDRVTDLSAELAQIHIPRGVTTSVKPTAPITQTAPVNNNYQQPPMDVQVAVAAFEINNPWLSTDAALSGAFQAIHANIARDPQFYGRPVTSHLNEALRRLQSQFPERFRKQSPPGGTGGINSGAPAGTSKAKVVLTPDEKAAARMLFAGEATQEKAEERYLRGKLLQEGGR